MAPKTKDTKPKVAETKKVEDEHSSDTSEEEIPQEDINENEILHKVESTLEDDPLNRIKKAADGDLDDGDKFLKNFLFKQGWVFDYETHGDRYKQQASDLDKGDMLDDQFDELDIESQRINLENSKIGTELPEKYEEEEQAEDDSEEQLIEDNDKEEQVIESVSAPKVSNLSEKIEQPESDNESNEDDDSSSVSSSDDSDISSDDKKEHQSERERKDSKKKRKRKAKNEKIKEQLESVKKEYNEKAEKIKKQIMELVFKLKELIKGDGSIVDKLKISSNDDTDTVWELIEKRKVIEEFAKSEAEDDDLMEDDEDEITSSSDNPLKLRRKVNSLFEDYYDSFFEDVNAATGDTYKYKYKSVDKTSCGLSAEDILNLEDDDLDKIVPIKHLVRYDYKEPDNRIKKDIHFKLKDIKTDKGLLKKKDERAHRFKTGSFTGSGIKDKKKNNPQDSKDNKQNKQNRQKSRQHDEQGSEQKKMQRSYNEKKPQQDKKRKQETVQTDATTKQPVLKKKKVDISKFADKESYSQEKDYVPVKTTNAPKQKPKVQQSTEEKPEPKQTPVQEVPQNSGEDKKKKRKRGKGGKKKGTETAE